MPNLSKTGVRKGRKKGQVNKRTLEVQEKLSRMDCDPIMGMACIAQNNLPCGTCRGELRTKYSLPAGFHASTCDAHPDSVAMKAYKAKPSQIILPGCTCGGIGERTCLSCYGSGWEACSPELRGKMFAEIAQYVLPKRKAIEHTGPDGGPVGMKLIVEYR